MMEKNTNNYFEFDLNTLLRPYITRWYWFPVGLSIAVLAALLYNKWSTPIYNVKSAVLIKDAKNSPIGEGNMGVLEGLSGFGVMSTNSIDNELEVFRTKKLSRDVVVLNHLQTALFSDKGIGQRELFGEASPLVINVLTEKENKKFPEKRFTIELINDRALLKSDEYNFSQEIVFGHVIILPFANIIITKNAKFNKEKAGDIGNKFELYFSTIENAASKVQKMIEVELADKESTIISLSINYPETDKAKTIITSLINAYNKDAILDKNSEAQKTKEFIDQRISIISRELGNVESEKERFKKNNKITDIFTEAKINLETSADAKKKQLELDSQLELTNNLIDYVKMQRSDQLLPVNIGLDNNEAISSISSYNRLILERNQLLENATVDNPLVQDVTKQITSLRRSVAEALQRNKTALQLSLNEYQTEQNEIESKITKIPYQEKLFRSFERQQQIKENLYLLLLQKREETAISLAVVAPKARIVEPVYISDKPVSPKKLITFVVSLVLGILLPFLILYLKELFNTKITSKDSLKALTEIPIIAEIPAVGKNVDHIVRRNDFSPLAESFRILVTNLSFLLPNNGKGKKIFVTSSIKGEGKTFVSMNLALSLTYSNSGKVVIIGADIRNPQLQRYNEGKNEGKGITEFLYDRNTLIDEIIFRNPTNENCDIIYSGIIPPNPTELLSNGRLNYLIRELENKYDYIIVDTAPLLLVTDTFTFINLADLKLYVTRSNFTDKKLIEFANDSVDSGKLESVAFVLNDVTKQNFGYGNKYGYGYNNK